MKKETVTVRVQEVISPFILQEDLELVDVEYKKEHANWYLRIFIDKPGGVRLEDCEKVSNFASAELERLGVIPSRYFLEVSSPGVERPLRKPEDFERFCGSTIRLRTTSKIQGSRNFQGMLVDYVDDQVILETEDGRSINIPYHLIRQARLKIY
ncbi:MAG: ribosome maturation factor RimP [Syntrophaceticus sp.]|nr:ribosome maturation factor RimP [Syntrophomonadaceae bacterium]